MFSAVVQCQSKVITYERSSWGHETIGLYPQQGCFTGCVNAKKRHVLSKKDVLYIFMVSIDNRGIDLF